MVLCFNDTATTEIYTLSLHDALPIYGRADVVDGRDYRAGDFVHRPSVGGAVVWRACTEHDGRGGCAGRGVLSRRRADRKSTRLNSSHANISYAVFCFQKTHHIPTLSI